MFRDMIGEKGIKQDMHISVRYQRPSYPQAARASQMMTAGAE
jgi:3-mercaptopyruvate sulfurtransferase SseA